MKPMSLLGCGIVVSLLGGMAAGQTPAPPQPGDISLQASARAAVSSQDGPRVKETTPPAPRGDLRGDIASNVRARPETGHDDKPRRH